MKVLIPVLFLGLLVVSATVRADESDSVRIGLAGYWPLDETSGTNLPDFTSLHNDG